ncbi:MAG TPA: metal-sensitive transcriptional regulator [Acidimicrobiia bacterium]
MEFPQEVTDDLTKRLRRVEGQIRGIQAMLEDGRECRDVVTQLSAATRALESAGFRLVAAGLAYCVEHPEAAAETGYDVGELEKLFLKLG